MSDYPLERILEFVRKVVPFDTLADDELKSLVSKMEIAFFPAGEVIIRRGGPAAEALYIINAGSAKITLPPGEVMEDGLMPDPDGQEILVDIRGEGDTFGSVSLLQGSQALFEVTAREDLICYLVLKDDFKELTGASRAVRRHFSHSLARNLKAVRQSHHESLHRITGVTGLALDHSLVHLSVGEVMSKKPLTCLAATPVRAAAHRMSMRKVGSIVVVEDTGHPIGIITDRDLRERVLAPGASTEIPVAEVMSQPLYCLSPDHKAYEAMMEMSRHGVHHLVITGQDHLLGVLSDHDLQALTGSSPVGVLGDIEKVDNLEDLVSLHVKIDRVLEMLLRQGGDARTLLEIVTEFNDRLTRRLIRIVENSMLHEGKGRPPVPYVWLALGSEGRKEQTLRTDQDNALIFANAPPDSAVQIKAWFLAFAERVVEGLARCGFPLCKGGVMASNPRWCQTEAGWQETFLAWVQDPNPETLRLASIFFDYRPIYAEADFVETLDKRLSRAVEDNRLFLRFMAGNALFNVPPLGFFRQFVLDKSGEHKNKLNLKLSGLTPLVDAARVMALDRGIRGTNTLDRLDGVKNSGIIAPDLMADIFEAFSFMTLLRISRHLEARAAGEVPDNFIDPGSLNKLQRNMLKESFQVIRRLQDVMENHYQTRLAR